MQLKGDFEKQLYPDIKDNILYKKWETFSTAIKKITAERKIQLNFQSTGI